MSFLRYCCLAQVRVVRGYPKTCCRICMPEFQILVMFPGTIQLPVCMISLYHLTMRSLGKNAYVGHQYFISSNAFQKISIENNCIVQYSYTVSRLDPQLSFFKEKYFAAGFSCTHTRQRNPSPEQSQPNDWKLGRDSPFTWSSLHIKTGSLGKMVGLHYIFSPLKAYLAVLPHSADPCLVPTFIRHLIGICFS